MVSSKVAPNNCGNMRNYRLKKILRLTYKRRLLCLLFSWLTKSHFCGEKNKKPPILIMMRKKTTCILSFLFVYLLMRFVPVSIREICIQKWTPLTARPSPPYNAGNIYIDYRSLSTLSYTMEAKKSVVAETCWNYSSLMQGRRIDFLIV